MQQSNKGDKPFFSWPSQLELKFRFFWLEPMRFSGPNLRWLAHVISNDAQGVSEDPQPAAMRPLLVLDYDCDGANARVEADIINLKKKTSQAFVTRNIPPAYQS